MKALGLLIICFASCFCDLPHQTIFGSEQNAKRKSNEQLKSSSNQAQSDIFRVQRDFADFFSRNPDIKISPSPNLRKEPITNLRTYPIKKVLPFGYVLRQNNRPTMVNLPKNLSTKIVATANSNNLQTQNARPDQIRSKPELRLLEEKNCQDKDIRISTPPTHEVSKLEIHKPLNIDPREDISKEEIQTVSNLGANAPTNKSTDDKPLNDTKHNQKETEIKTMITKNNKHDQSRKSDVKPVLNPIKALSVDKKQPISPVTLTNTDNNKEKHDLDVLSTPKSNRSEVLRLLLKPLLEKNVNRQNDLPDTNFKNNIKNENIDSIKITERNYTEVIKNINEAKENVKLEKLSVIFDVPGNIAVKESANTVEDFTNRNELSDLTHDYTNNDFLMTTQKNLLRGNFNTPSYGTYFRPSAIYNELSNSHQSQSNPQYNYVSQDYKIRDINQETKEVQNEGQKATLKIWSNREFVIKSDNNDPKVSEDKSYSENPVTYSNDYYNRYSPCPWHYRNNNDLLWYNYYNPVSQPPSYSIYYN